MTAQESPEPKAVGAAGMQAEHQLLHDLLNRLQSALAAGHEDTVAELLGLFEDAANLHFMEEQTLMRLHAYPGYAAHQEEHDDLSAELVELSRRINAGKFADAAAAAKSLEKWLMTHMHTTDVVLEQYLEEEGIRTSSHA